MDPLNLPFLAVTPSPAGSSRGSGRPTRAGWASCWAERTLWLSRLGVDSTYASIWPAYALIGLGYGLLVPAVSSAAMGAVPAANSGVGAGVLNTPGRSARRSGSRSSARSGMRRRRRRGATTGRLPPRRGEAAALGQQVAGAEADVVGRALGSEALRPAHEAFATGLQTGLAVAGIAMLLAAPIAFLGLRGRRA